MKRVLTEFELELCQVIQCLLFAMHGPLVEFRIAISKAHAVLDKAKDSDQEAFLTAMDELLNRGQDGEI